MTAKRKSVRKKKAGPVFPEAISGTCGSFVTPAGTIQYLSTKATLRFSGTPSEDEEQTAHFTQFLAPAREVLDVSKLGFDQLLQRDLDDNRIVHELIPYVLGSKRTGLPLFPPIVAMLLPFRGQKMLANYERITPKRGAHEEWEGMWETNTFGHAFQIETPVDGSVTPNFAILRWNRENCRFVVLDGQHRAMALLGIFRINNDSWPGDAKKFEVFYRESVENRLHAPGVKLPELIELPVMVTWIPDHQCNLPATIRKLFVDINSNARLPSPSRILLLSDDSLDNHLTRRLLSLIRGPDSAIPLAAVEYDYPIDGRKSIGRWSCFSNVEILKELIHWLVFRARQVLNRCDGEVMKKGKKSGSDFNMSLREELHAKELGAQFDEGEEKMEARKISNTYFPRFNKEKLEQLLSHFADCHGKPLIELFANTSPYKAHFVALEEFMDGFDEKYGVTPEPSLCHEALFEGQGVYWTIRRGAEAKRSTKLTACWKLLSTTMMDDFCEIRRNVYFGKTVPKDSRRAFDSFFDVVRTTAAQGGLGILFGLICRSAGAKKPVERSRLAKAIADGISKGLAGGKRRKTRHLFLASGEGVGSLNRLRKLEPRFAGFWRYLWLEAMVAGIGSKGLIKNGLTEASLLEMVDQGRTYYALGLVEIRKKDLKRAEPTKGDEQVDKEAKDIVIRELTRAFQDGLGFTKPAAEKLWKSALERSLGEEADGEAEEEDDDDDDDPNMI